LTESKTKSAKMKALMSRSFIPALLRVWRWHSRTVA
jgi:hypothetical protein